MHNDIENTILQYIEGDLTKDQELKVKSLIEQNDDWSKTYQELQTLFEHFENAPQEQPSEQLNLRFQQLIEEEKTKTTPLRIEHKNEPTIRRMNYWRVAAAAVVLLIMGFGAGSYFEQSQQLNAMKNEMRATQEMLLAFQKESASERIKAVNYSIQQEPNDDILNALIQVMLLDENVNVRVKAIEGLVDFPHKHQVIDTMIKLLHKEIDPEVQMALIDALTYMETEKAVDEFQHILEQENIQEFVKNKAAYGLQVLL